MALSARDLYFAVRVEDRATRPLRRIASDMRALGKTGLAARQRDVSSAKLAQQRAVSARRVAIQEYASVRSGRARLALDAQQIKAKNQLVNAGIREAGVEQQIRRNYEQRLGQTVKISQLERALAQNRGVRRGVTVPETRVLHQQALSGMATLNRQQEILAQRAGLSPQAIDAATARVKELEAAEAELATREQTLRGRVRASSDAYRLSTSRLNEAKASVQSFPIEKLQTVGTAASHAGKALTFLGAAGTAALAFAGKSAADFSTQVTVAATQSTTAGRNAVADVQKNAAYIQNAIQRMLSGGRVIASPEDQTSAIYRIFSGLTLKGNQLSQLRQGIQLLREFNRVTTANVGLVTLEESTRAGIILINRFGVSAKNIRPALNTMQAAVRYGDMTMSEFIGTLNQMAPASQTAGYNFTQMSGAAAFLSRQFPSLRMGAAGYARLLEIFARKDVIAGLKARNVEITRSVGGVQKLIPLNQIAHRVIDRFGGSVQKGSVFLQNFFKEIGNTQGTIQGRRALESYVHHIGLADRILRDVSRDHKELQKSFRAAQESPGVRWQEFVNQLKALSLEIGAGVIPAVGYLAGHVQRLAEWFNNLTPSTRKMIGEVALFTSVGVVLGGVILTLVGGLVSLRIVATQLAGAFGIGLASEAGFASIQLIALLGVAGALVTIFMKWPGVLKTVTDALGGTKAAIETLLLLMAVQKLGLFSSIAAQAVVATGAVTGLEVALASLAGVGTIILTVIVLRKLLDERGSPLHGLSPEAKDFGHDFIQSLKHPLDFHKSVRVFVDVKNVLGSHDAGRQAEQDLRDDLAKVDPIQAESGRRAQTDMRRQFDIKPHIRSIIGQARRAAASFGVDATKTFQKLFANYLSAVKALDTLKKSGTASISELFLAEQKVSTASAALSANADKQKVAAAKRAATDVLHNQKRFSDAQIVAEERNVLRLERLAKKTKTIAAWKTYYAAVAKLSKDATDSQLQAVQRLFEEIPKAAEKSADQTAKKLREKYQQVLQNLESTYSTFYSKNQNLFGQLFQGPYTQSAVVQNRLQFGAGPTANLNKNDLLKDLRSQVRRFSSIQRTIGRLRGRGLPSALLDQIQQLGPEEAQKMLRLINRMTPRQINEYSRLWRQGQKEVHDATMRDVRNQLKEWRRHGRRIGLAIAAGLRDENTALESSLRNLITKMFPELAGKNTKTPARHTGGGVRSTGKDAKPKQEHHTHYHVIAAPHDTDATIKKQLDSANWHHRTRQK